MTEKTFYAAFIDTDEIKWSEFHGNHINGNDIFDLYIAHGNSNNGSVKLFDNAGDAIDYIRGKGSTELMRGNTGEYLYCTVAYVEEQIWTVDDGGNAEDLVQGIRIVCIDVEPYGA